MWDFLSKLVDALPAWFLIALITALLAAAAWYLPRLRRDKNGRLYIYSRSYEYQKNRIKEQTRLFENQGKIFDELKSDIAGLDKRTKSIECENLKQTFYIDNEAFPKAERLIAGLKYVCSGGNGAAREDVFAFIKANLDVYGEVIKDFPQWALPRGGGDG
jgi:hypothetical protein